MQKSFIYTYQGKEYPVLVIYKRKKNITYRIKDGQFVVSAPNFVSLARIKEGLDKFAAKLITRYEREQSAINDERVFLFGEELPYSSSGGEIIFKGMSIKYETKEELIDTCITLYSKYMIDRTRYYESLMGVTPPYKIKIKKMKSRFGSNSKKTHTISYASHLFSYSNDILDSLIVHELAHHFAFDHSKNFYSIVYKYCPNYKKDNIKLKKRIYR